MVAPRDSYETLRIQREGPLLWCTLARPERFNALNPVLCSELHNLLDSLLDDRVTRVVILRGQGKHFCAGLDLKDEDFTRTNSEELRFQRRVGELIMKMRYAPQPFIALVQGAASGGGFTLALASDVRIAGDSCRMNVAFIRIGLSGCDIGTSYFLPRLVGTSLASELLLTGNFIHADRALASGLVSQVVPDSELEKAGREMAEAMLHSAPLGLRLTKETLRMSVDAGSLEAVIAMEDRNQTLCAPDGIEGARAFLEKRPPKYPGA